MREERRRFIRIHSRLMVIVKFLDTGKVRRALTKNISAGGICLVTEELLKTGTQVEVELKLPDRDKAILLMGIVKWSKPIGEPPKPYENPTAETGVEFVQIDPDDQRQLMFYAKLNTPPE